MHTKHRKCGINADYIFWETYKTQELWVSSICKVFLLQNRIKVEEEKTYIHKHANIFLKGSTKRTALKEEEEVEEEVDQQKRVHNFFRSTVCVERKVSKNNSNNNKERRKIRNNQK